MNNEKILSMDSFILLSWVNTKLRDEFTSLEELCKSFDLDSENILGKLKQIGYMYSQNKNQFISSGILEN